MSRLLFEESAFTDDGAMTLAVKAAFLEAGPDADGETITKACSA